MNFQQFVVEKGQITCPLEIDCEGAGCGMNYYCMICGNWEIELDWCQNVGYLRAEKHALECHSDIITNEVHQCENCEKKFYKLKYLRWHLILTRNHKMQLNKYKLRSLKKLKRNF